MRFTTLLAAIVLAAATPATAQTYEQLRSWRFDDTTDDQVIQACDAVIKAGANRRPI